MVRLLLDRGADVHAENDEALRAARRNGHEAVIALLLERSADANAHGSDDDELVDDSDEEPVVR